MDVNRLLRQTVRGELENATALAQLKSRETTIVPFDIAARAALFNLCEDSVDATKDIQRLLEIVLDCAEQSICGTDLALSMLEEAMDVQTIAGCDELFAFLETHRQRMTAKMGKGMALLRLCNELLRRLSKTQDTVFCGRILIFLSLVFPLSERSAVNLKGEYNVDNVTTYEIEDDAEDAMQVDPEEGTEELGGVSPDAIYSTFWSLQSSFNTPSQIISAPLIFTRFRKSLEIVLEALEKIQGATQKHTEGKGVPQVQVAEDAKKIRGYFTPKVLTSKKLLSLELADVSFRRHILVQILIVLDYLLGMTAQNKKEWNKTTPTTNKSLLNPYVLSTTDAEWATGMRSRATTLMSSGKVGRHFLKVVEMSMKRDASWLRWKCDGCTAYDIPAVEDAKVQEAAKKFSFLTAAKKPYIHKVGNAVISKLWASAGGWTDAELQQAYPLSSPESYEKVISALDVEIGGTIQDEEIYELEDKKSSQSWRALRAARFSGLRHFTEQVAGGNVQKFIDARDGHDTPVETAVATSENVSSDAEPVVVLEATQNVSSTTSVKRPAAEVVADTVVEKRQKLMDIEESAVSISQSGEVAPRNTESQS